MGKGVTAGVAHTLAQTYGRQRIGEKIELLDYKLELQAQGKLTGRPISDPAAFLIDAIKKNYQLPVGFQTKADREATRTAQKQQLAARERLADARKQQERAMTQQQELARVQRLDTLRQHHHTGEREDHLWHTTLQTLKAQISEVMFKAYLAHSALLSLRHGQAVIAVPNEFVRQWIEKHLTIPIQAALASHEVGHTVTIQYRTLDENEHQKSAS